MRKFVLLLCIIVLIFSAPSVSFARTWSSTTIVIDGQQWFGCGETPSLALLYGVQPVVSNYQGDPWESNFPVHQTAFGWEYYPLARGYVAGNGGKSIISVDTPVNLGQDGRFYRAIDPVYLTHVALRPVSLDGWAGPEWTYGVPCGRSGFVTADPNGAVYMAVGDTVARLTGSTWSAPVQLDLTATDLAVSCYGDIAVSGISKIDGSKCVAWFDFRSGKWVDRKLTLFPGEGSKIDVEWDKYGNLGVAYSYLGNVKFDYLNMETTQWTSEKVNQEPGELLLGAALAYDRFGNPVIACGTNIYYDPAPAPEPSSILALLTGMAGLGFTLRRSSRAR